MNQTPNESGLDLEAPNAPALADGYMCVACGYALDGLPATGVCPECGASVADSMRGVLLEMRSLEYLKTLRRGLLMILYGILLLIIVQVGGGVVGAAIGAGGGTVGSRTVTAVQIAVGGLSLAVQLAVLWGWWIFTTRDPGDLTPDRATTARLVVRGAVVAQAGFQFVNLVATVLALVAFSGGGGAGSPMVAAAIVSGVVAGVGSIAALATQFFAAMLYVRALAWRIPSEKIARLCKSRMIACPIWATVGLLAFFLGPLIALILYWNLLNMVSKALKGIITRVERGGVTA